jgi:metallo-beta-lactamase class B
LAVVTHLRIPTLFCHPEKSDFAGKRARAKRCPPRAWVDPEGYRKWVVGERRKFEAIVAREMACP